MEAALPTNDGIPAIEDLHPGTHVTYAGQWHGVVVFNRTTSRIQTSFRNPSGVTTDPASWSATRRWDSSSRRCRTTI